MGNLKQEQKKRSKSWKKDMEEMRSAYERQLHEVDLLGVEMRVEVWMRVLRIGVCEGVGDRCE